MKKWLTDHFLPMWAKETVLMENHRLKAQNDRLSQKVRELESYVKGMHAGLRGSKHISIGSRGGDT